MDFKQRLLLLTILLFASQIYSQSKKNLNQTSAFVEGWSNHPYFKNASVGIAVHDIETGVFIGGYNSEKSLIPASTMKVLTTFSLYNAVGPQFQYVTKLGYAGNINSSGTMEGNIFIIGSGDPSLGSGRFEGYPSLPNLLDSIKQKISNQGIKFINGRVIVDASIFKSYPIGTTWQYDDLGSYYGAGTWGLNVNENEYALMFDTKRQLGSQTSIISTEPIIPNLKFINEVTVDSSYTGDNSYIYGGPNEFTKRVVGTLGYNENPVKTRGSMPNPPLYFSYGVSEHLLKNDISNKGYLVNDLPLPMNLMIFDSIISPPLQMLVKETNNRSINQYCDAYLQHLGILNNGIGSNDEGINYVKDNLTKMGINIDGLNQEDGSGLSARNLITPTLLSDFISKFTDKYTVETVKGLLPQAGVEGTVRSLFRTSPLSQKIWMKSGSLSGVMAYAGIIQAKSGNWVSFSLMINHYSESSRNVRQQVEALLTGIHEMN